MDWIFHHPPSSYNYHITSIPEYIISIKSRICYLSPVSPLNRPFKVTMTWGFYFFSRVSSQTFRITFMDVSKTSSPRNPLHKPITTDFCQTWYLPFPNFYLPFLLYVPSPQQSLHHLTSYSKIMFLDKYHLQLISSRELSKPRPLTSTRCICEIFTGPWKNSVPHFQHSISI